MRRFSVVMCLLLAASTAAGQGVLPGSIPTTRLSKASAARYVSVVMHGSTATGTALLGRYMYPFAAGARLVDVIVYQYTTGSGGTSWSADVRDQAGVSKLTTASVLTLASGIYAKTDAKGELSLPAGCTRPVLKTDANIVVGKGEFIDVVTTETGTYTVHPTVVAVLVLEPLQ